MTEFDVNKYEYKSPSYQLSDRNRFYDFKEEKNKEQSRFFYDEEAGIYRSKADIKEEISLLFAGDLLCQENMIASYRTGENQYDFDMCFDYMRPLFKSCDFAAGNLETPIADTAPYRGEIITHEGPFFCNAPIEYLKALKHAGFDMLTTANNHTIDAGVRGLYETIINARKFDFIQTGTFTEKCDKFVIVDVCGFKVGFTAFSTVYNSMQLNMPGKGRTTLLNTYTEKRARDVYETMKKHGAEYVVCFPHWGKEFSFEITEKQMNMAKTMTEIGYDFVVGSHAHWIQRFEYINDKPVLFGLGNLISHMNHGVKLMDTQYPVVCQLKLSRVNEEINAEIDFIPCRIVKNANKIPFTVLPCVNGLKLSDKLSGLLSKTPEKVKQMLEVSSDMINTMYELDSDAVEELRRLEARQEQLIASFLQIEEKEMSTSVNDQEIEYDELPLLENAKYVEVNECRHICYEKHAELMEILATASVIRLPKDVKNVPVTKISNTSKGNSTTRIVYIGKFVEEIERESFAGFSKLESVRFFANLKVIGEGAFKNCCNMTGLIMPTNLEMIKAHAFKDCKKLLSIKLTNSITYIADDAFEGCNDLTIYCEEGTYADEYAKRMQIPVKYMPMPKPSTTLQPTKNAASENTTFYEPKQCNAPILEPMYGKEIQVNGFNVKLGLCNDANERHPLPILEACRLLNVPLPENAVCKYQPSRYIEKGTLNDNLDHLLECIGDKLGAYDRDEIAKNYRSFRRKYKTQENLSYNYRNLNVYFADWLLHCKNRGFTHNCYFDYELYKKEADVRDTFLNEGYRTRVFRACNKKGYRKAFLNKASFNKTFKDNVKRDWIDASVCSFEEFKEYMEKHDRVFGKPVEGTGGAGARVIECNSDTLENLYEICKKDELILEEVIKQHPSLAEFNDSTLNTVRINTLYCADGVVRIMLTVARFGRAGNVVDNFHGGGVGAIVDIDSGVIITEAINRAHLKDSVHPDSKKSILGFQYPEWEKVKKAVCDAALLTPNVRHIGWDVCVTDKGEVEFVEGNSRPNFDVLQSPDQLGRRFRYEPYLPELERLEGIEP